MPKTSTRRPDRNISATVTAFRDRGWSLGHLSVEDTNRSQKHIFPRRDGSHLHRLTVIAIQHQEAAPTGKIAAGQVGLTSCP